MIVLVTDIDEFKYLNTQRPQVCDARSKPGRAMQHTVKSKQADVKHEHKTINSAEDTRPWKERTKLVLSMLRKKPVIHLKAQSPEITTVLHRSFEIGQLIIAFGRDVDSKMTVSEVSTMYNPMAPGANGLDYIALEALITAAEEQGFDGEFDIAHQLEEGSVKYYIEPMRNYVCLMHYSSSSD